MNLHQHSWAPSDELKMFLSKPQVTPNELLQTIIECYTFLLGSDEAFSGPIIKNQLRLAGVDHDNPVKKDLIKASEYLKVLTISFRDVESTSRSHMQLRKFIDHCSDGNITDTDTVDILNESDVTTARNTALTKARNMGFSKVDCNKIATSVSELARNIILYTPGGTISITGTINNERKSIEIVAEDKGGGIENINIILSGNYQSKRGLGKGISGSKILMDEFAIQTGENGTRIDMAKHIWR